MFQFEIQLLFFLPSGSSSPVLLYRPHPFACPAALLIIMSLPSRQTHDDGLTAMQKKSFPEHDRLRRRGPSVNSLLPEGSWKRPDHLTHTGKQVEWNRPADSGESYFERAQKGQRVRRTDSAYNTTAWKNVLDGSVALPPAAPDPNPAASSSYGYGAPPLQIPKPKPVGDGKLNHMLDQIDLPHLKERFAVEGMDFEAARQAIDVEGRQLWLTRAEMDEMLKTFEYYDEIHAAHDPYMDKLRAHGARERRLSDLGRHLVKTFNNINLGPSPAEIQARLARSDQVIAETSSPRPSLGGVGAGGFGGSAGGGGGGGGGGRGFGALTEAEKARYHAEIDALVRQVRHPNRILFGGLCVVPSFELRYELATTPACSLACFACLVHNIKSC